MKNINSRLGEINYNKFNNKMTIIEYNGANDIKVKFESGDIVHSTYSHFKDGSIKSYYDKTICNIGFLGEGIYTISPTKINPNSKQAYRIWKGLFDRCYKHYNEQRNYVYNECEVCEEWHNFQNFAKWYYENYYEIDEQLMCLDKDILHKGNKIYSPENCIFVPQRINKLFTKSNRTRGSLPIGATFEKSKIRVRISIYDSVLNKKRAYFLGYFETPKEAFQAYKEAKEKYIKQVADEYKDKIPQKLYDAMYKYVVEITD